MLVYIAFLTTFTFLNRYVRIKQALDCVLLAMAATWNYPFQAVHLPNIP